MIRVGLLDGNGIFAKRLMMLIKEEYEDLVFYSFLNVKQAKTAADNSLIDLFVIDRSIFINQSESSIPTSCRTAVLVDDEKDAAGLSLPVVFRYKSLDEWHETICLLAEKETALSSVKCGVDRRAGLTDRPVYLFLSQNGSDAASSACAFCRFLNNNGIEKVAVFGQFSESGEGIWRKTEALRSRCGAVALFMSLEKKNDAVIPVQNADAVAFLSDGSKRMNKYIAKTAKQFTKFSGSSGQSLYRKSGVLLYGMKTDGENSLEKMPLTPLGGLDNEENQRAAFEKLVILCMRK